MILHTMSSCKSLHFFLVSSIHILVNLLYKKKVMHFALWYVVLVRHHYDVCEHYVGSVYLGWYVGLSESGLCVFQ